jgi:transposase
MRQTHIAGEKLFVDYCGQTMPIVDPHTGEILYRAQVFVAVLGPPTTPLLKPPAPNSLRIG